MKEYFLSIRWGEKSLVALYLSLLSGVVLALQYNPADPLFSVSSVDILIPFGSFWRSLHFYSSQLCFVLSLFQCVAVLAGGRTVLPAEKWLLLVGSLPTIVLLLFTGYVLRGDATGTSAGLIAENIALSVPVFGHGINAVLFSITDSGLIRVYANHIISLGLLWLVMSWDHVRRYRVGMFSHGGLVAGLAIFCLVWNAPMEPERVGVLYVTGPWFFMGLQEMLRIIDSLWAGVVFPASLLAALFLYRGSERRQKICAGFAGGWLALYSILTVIAALR